MIGPMFGHRYQRLRAKPVAGGALLLAAALCCASVARAQFYDLDGTYRCVTAPDTACKKSLEPPPPLPPPPPATPSVAEAIAHIRAEKVTAADIAVLEQQAAAKEPRAVEALAWLKLNGIGMTADPVEAYVLYGEAASLGVAGAETNQAAIFETRLNQEQRQLALMREQSR